MPNEREFSALEEWPDEQIEQAETPKRIHLLMKLACHTGMRLGEIAILKWKRGAEDFGTRHSRNYVYLETEEKNLIVTFKRKLRGIPVEHIWGVLEKMLGRREPSDTYVFTSPATGSPYTVPRLCGKWKEEVKKMGALSRPYTSYSIRHGAATHLLCQNVPVYAVGKIVGTLRKKSPSVARASFLTTWRMR